VEVAVALAGTLVKNGKSQDEISKLTTVSTVMAVNSLVRKKCIELALMSQFSFKHHDVPAESLVPVPGNEIQ
jgi:hypothetical protein